jgi:signal peptidase I
MPATIVLVRAVLRRVRRNWVLEVALTVAFALLLFMAVQAYAVKPYRIPSASMEPTLHVGDRVLVNRFSHHLGAEPAVGQIVVFHPPSGAEVAAPRCGRRVAGGACARPVGPASSDTFVKRVVGVSGDRIAVRDGHVIRNGSRQREPFAAPCGGGGECDLPRPVTVPRGFVFVMGDNRGASSDSRAWGPVPVDWVIGEAVAVYWPPGRAEPL